MLVFHTANARIETSIDIAKNGLPQGTSWIDALNPDEKEIAFLERVLAINVPTYDRLVEIESSSRLATENDHIFLSLPLVLRSDDGMRAPRRSVSSCRGRFCSLCISRT